MTYNQHMFPNAMQRIQEVITPWCGFQTCENLTLCRPTVVCHSSLLAALTCIWSSSRGWQYLFLLYDIRPQHLSFINLDGKVNLQPEKKQVGKKHIVKKAYCYGNMKTTEGNPDENMSIFSHLDYEAQTVRGHR